MNKLSQCLVILLTLVIYGCGGGSAAVHVDHVVHVDDVVHVDPPYNYTPELHSFNMVDSYGTDTTQSNDVLVLDPYISFGEFEVYWSANSLEDYRVNILINDYPDLINSVLITTELCGLGLWCDQEGGFLCEYNVNSTISCDSRADPIDISFFLDEFPKTLYMFVEICDTDSDYCETDHYPVIME